MARPRKPPPPSPPRRKPEQLELFAPAGEPGNVWDSVDTLNERTARAHLERRKPVKRKVRQRSLLDEPAPPPDD